MNNQYGNLMKLICCVLTGDRIKLIEPQFDVIFQIAQAQRVANLLYPAYRILPETEQPDGAHLRLCKELAYAAVTREVFRDKELERLLSALREVGVLMLPLKGCVLKEDYPKPGYRDMTDVDLLVRPEDAEKINAVMNQLNYKTQKYNADSTDFYVSPMNLCYEVHKSLYNEGYTENSKKFLADLYHMAILSEDKTVLTIPPEEHYVYILAHLVKHLFHGGGGLRPVMDIWICRKKWHFDHERLDALLSRTDLLEFSKTAEKLGRIWFEGEEPDELSEELSQYLLSGNLYGTEERKVENRLLEQGTEVNRFLYYWKRLFPSYTGMCSYFPVLRKCAILLPVFWIVRLIRSVIFRRGKLSVELNAVKATDEEILKKRYSLFERSGLHMSRKDGSK